MTPPKEELEAKAKHFANTVFVIGAGVMMLAASLLQPLAIRWIGPSIGEHISFITATILIFVLATKRPALALFALERQCLRYGHVLREGSTVCERCYQTVATEVRQSGQKDG